jgi:hypothetical protein
VAETGTENVKSIVRKIPLQGMVRKPPLLSISRSEYGEVLEGLIAFGNWTKRVRDLRDGSARHVLFQWA